MPAIQRPERAAPRESTVQDRIRLALGQEPDLVLWRLSNGAAPMVGAGGAETLVQMGIKGAADLIGILRMNRVFGRFFALEVKAPGKLPRHTIEELEARGPALPGGLRHELEQLHWARLVRSFGGFAAFVSSEDEARAALHRAREGRSE